MRAPLPLQEEEEEEAQALDEIHTDTKDGYEQAKPLWLSHTSTLRDLIKPCCLRFTMADGHKETVYVVYFSEESHGDACPGST